MAEPEPSAQPEAVLPGMAQRRRAPTRGTPHARAIAPGDLVCGQCGEGNLPERRFCRRCGASLADARPAPRLSWWRRLLNHFRRAAPVAGARPRRFGAQGADSGRRALGLGAIFKVLGPIALVVVAILALAPIPNPIGRLRTRLVNDVRGAAKPTYVTIHPTAAAASSTAPGHSAALAIDGISNTSWWAASTPSGGVAQELVLTVAPPASLDHVGFLSGAQDTPQDFLRQPRPKGVRVTLFDPSGALVGEKVATLADQPGFQTVAVGGKDVAQVKVQILSVYPGTAGTDVAISEVELFHRKL